MSDVESADGVPPNPGAWLTTTANRKAIGGGVVHRSGSSYGNLQALKGKRRI